jgi:hypothetical protein
MIPGANDIGGMFFYRVDRERLDAGNLRRVDAGRVVEQERASGRVWTGEGSARLQVQALAAFGLHDVESNAAGDLSQRGYARGIGSG